MAGKSGGQCFAATAAGAGAGGLKGANSGADLANKIAPGDKRAAIIGAALGFLIGGIAGGAAGSVAGGCWQKGEDKGRGDQKITTANTTATVGWALIVVSESLPRVPSTFQAEQNEQLIQAVSLGSPILWASGITLQIAALVQAATE